jgi:TrmH family RNA methyltransferase
LVADIRRTETARGRALLGCFAIEGTRAHERALRAAAPLQAVLLSEGYRADRSPRVRRLLAELRACGCRLETAPDAVLEAWSGGRDVGAVVGLVRLPRDAQLDSVFRTKAPLLLVGIDVQDPGNVGALVRTALASGCDGYLAVGRGDPFHPRAVRTSMGSVLKLPILRYAGVRPLVELLERHGVRKVGAVSSGGNPLPRASFGDRGVAVFLGSEAFGLGEETVDLMDERLTVPMIEGVDSFSVNAAAAIILYEIRRNDGFAGGGGRA